MKKLLALTVAALALAATAHGAGRLGFRGGQPPAVPPSGDFVTSLSTVSFNATSASLSAYTWRFYIPPNTAVADGSMIRVYATAPAGNSVPVTNACIQRVATSGDLYDFNSACSPLLMSGSAGGTIAAGATQAFDDLSFTFDKTLGYVVSVYISGSAALPYRLDAMTSGQTCVISGNDYSTVNTSGYTCGVGGERTFISRIDTNGTPPATDTVPDAYTIVDLSNQPLSTQTVSASFTPLGYNAQTTWSISGSGCEMRVGAGAYATSGTVSPGQSMNARNTTSGSYSTAVNCATLIGGVPDNWSMTTIADPGGGGCTTPAEQTECFFGPWLSVSAENSVGGQYANSVRNAARDTYVTWLFTNAVVGFVPRYTSCSNNDWRAGNTPAAYGPAMEAFINYLRGGSDNRVLAACWMDKFLDQFLLPGYGANEPYIDMHSVFIFCQMQYPTPLRTWQEMCDHSRNFIDRMLQTWWPAQFTVVDTGSYPSPRVWAKLLAGVVMAGKLGLVSQQGYNWATLAPQMVTSILNLQHANGKWYTNALNGGAPNFQQSVLTVELMRYHREVDPSNTAVLAAIRRNMDWQISTQVWGGAAGNGTGRYGTIYASKSSLAGTVNCLDVQNGETDGYTCDSRTSDLGGASTDLEVMKADVLGYLYEQTGDPWYKLWMDRFTYSNWTGPYLGGYDTGGYLSGSPKHSCEQNCFGFQASYYTGLSPAAPSYPRITTAPTISGTVANNQTLTLTNGTYANCSSCTYQNQWGVFRGGNHDGSGAYPSAEDGISSGSYDLAGQTGGTYTIGSSMSGRRFWVRQRASNDGGTTWSAWNMSNWTIQVPKRRKPANDNRVIRRRRRIAA